MPRNLARQSADAWDESPQEVSTVHSTQPPPVVTNWLQALGQGQVPLFTIEAPARYRQEMYFWCEAIQIPKWRTKGIQTEVVWTALHRYEPVLKQLLQAESVNIEEPLKSMVDQPFYLVSDLFRVILEARFQVAEGADPSFFLSLIARWILDQKLGARGEKFFEAANVSRRVSSTEQLDLVFFLATLASHSGVVRHLTLALDGVEMAATAGVKERRTLLKELDAVAFGATRWEKMGCPLGVVLGVDRLAPLENSAPKLSKLIRSGIVHQFPV